MKFGLCLPNFPFGVRPTREAIVEVAREAERLGYDSAWVSDHLLVPGDKPRYGRLFEVLSTIAYLGGMTERLRLGTSVLVLPYRNAVIVAKQAATIDALTEGRLILGVGAGWIQGEFDNLGVEYHDRGQLLNEGLAVMKTLWTSENPQFDGDFYQFSDALFEPKPAQSGGIPIWVGGHSEAALRRTVRYGDAWHADDLPHEQLADYTKKLEALSDGRPIGVTLRRTVDLRPAMAAGAAGGQGGEAAGRWPGGSASALAGSTEEIRNEIAALAELGLDSFICQFEHQTQQEHLDQMRFFAREIAAHFAG